MGFKIGSIREIGWKDYNFSMEKVWFRKGLSFEEEAEADREFWLQMTGRERVAALEELRRDVWKITGERVEGLRRVVRVLQRTES